MSNESDNNIYYTDNGAVSAILKYCPSCSTISKFKFRKNGELKPYGKKCIKCYSITSNFKSMSEGYFTEYYQNNKDTIKNAAKKHYHDHKMILISEQDGVRQYKDKKGRTIEIRALEPGELCGLKMTCKTY